MPVIMVVVHHYVLVVLRVGVGQAQFGFVDAGIGTVREKYE